MVLWQKLSSRTRKIYIHSSLRSSINGVSALASRRKKLYEYFLSFIEWLGYILVRPIENVPVWAINVRPVNLCSTPPMFKPYSFSNQEEMHHSVRTTHPDKKTHNETHNSIKSSFTISFNRSHVSFIMKITIPSG